MMYLHMISLVYENFELYNPTITLELLVWSMCAGLIIGAVSSFINNRVLGDYVRALIKAGIHTPEEAKTLEESGFSRNFFVKRALRDGGLLRRFVHIAGEETEARTDPKTARFYIPEELRISAELRYEERGNTAMSLVFSILLLIAAALAVLFLVPEILQLTDNFLTMIG